MKTEEEITKRKNTPEQGGGWRRSMGEYAEKDYPHSGLTSRIIGCAIEVHRTLGPGFEEVFYQRALNRELEAAGIDAAREVWMDVRYKGIVLGKKRVDFVTDECLVEIKAKRALEDVDKAQTLSYLKATGYPVGLLINFGGVKLEVKRIANTRGRGAESLRL
jgi:GxxExxY protein